MGSDGVYKTGLELSLCSDLDDHTENDKNKKRRSVIITSLKYDHLFPSDLRLGPVSIGVPSRSDGRDHHTSPDRVLHRQASSLSSFSNSSASTPVVVKRDRDVISGEYAETETQRRAMIGNNDDQEDIDEEQGSPRKKLRLTKQQSAVLEDTFRDHATLNPKQKQELARELNLRPRQVEVWFQNRRARNKLKQTEADYEQWKRCCATLTEENKKLQKELQELRSLKLITAPFYTPFATSPPVICPSCQRLGPNKPNHFISAPLTPSSQHPSAAC